MGRVFVAAAHPARSDMELTESSAGSAQPFHMLYQLYRRQWFDKREKRTPARPQSLDNQFANARSERCSGR